MFRVRIDPGSRFGRYFRPGAAAVIVIVALVLAFLELRSPQHDRLAIIALISAAAVGTMVFANYRR
jgi:hypothetical protein